MSPGEPARPRDAGSLARTVWRISLPILFAEVSETIIHVTDTLLLARVGTTELAALALAETLLEIWTVVAVALAEAMQIVIARRVGQDRRRAVGAAFNVGAVLVIVTSLALAVGLKAASPPVSGALVGSEAVGTEVDRYLQIAAYGFVFYGLGLAYSALWVGLGRTRVLIYATVVLTLTNLVLSYAFIFGRLGAPQLGIEGAAIGFVGAEAVTFAFFTAWTVRRLDVRAYGFFRLGTSEADVVRPLVRLSPPVALQGLVEGVRWFVFFLILERVSEDALAASNIVYACYGIFVIPTEAFSETTNSLVSRLIGRGESSRLRSLMRQLLRATYVVTLPIVLLALAFPELLLSVFTEDPVLVEQASGSLRVLAVAMLVVTATDLWMAAVTGTADTDAAFGIEVVLTAVMLAAAYVAGQVLELSAPLIWASLPLASLVCLPIAYHWVRAGYWRRLAV